MSTGSASKAFPVVYEAPILSLQGVTLDLAPYFTPCRIRLVDVAQLEENGILRIYEVPRYPNRTLPHGREHPFSAISYVWRGYNLDDPSSRDHPTFSVKGAENADPINIPILVHACTVSLLRGARYLWLDRLCIMQTSVDDTAWQITQMYDIYRFSLLCIALPGGIRRLARLDEDTPWIHRTWTLQELIAPGEVFLLFAFPHGPGTFSVGTATQRMEGAITEIVPGECACALVPELLLACSEGHMSFVPRASPESITLPLRIFGPPSSPQLWTTLGALHLSDDLARYHAIWRCALMRTSLRPEDMVFSIMGLFGIRLDVRAFAGTGGSRAAPTIAFAQAFLARGGGALWLAGSFFLPPAPGMSSFPASAETSISGRAYVRVPGGGLEEVLAVVDGDGSSGWWIDGLPGGSMSDDGYLTLSARAAAVLPAEAASERDVVTALDGSAWRVEQGALDEEPRYLAVFIGVEKRYMLRDLFEGLLPNERAPVRVVLVEAHGTGKYHRLSFFFLDPSWMKNIDAWPIREVAIGGPLPSIVADRAALTKV